MVYIIVLNWNNSEDTISCISTLLKQNYIYFRIVLVDNDSTDDSLIKILAFLKKSCQNYLHLSESESYLDEEIHTNKITVISATSNKGYAGGNNIGIKYALQSNDCKYIWVLNNDTEVESNSLSLLVSEMERDKEIGILGSKLVYYHNKKVHNTPDGNFPNGIPNPLLPECRDDTRNAVIKHGADMGIAFDGDFDRCFLFDEKGQFIEGYYIVGLLAEAFLEKNPGAKIIHDPRLSWNTVDVVTAAGGTPVMSKTGHAFIKERMRKEDAIYGGEMSAHHYFRDFAYCDSGMIPWLLVAELVCLKGKTLGELVRDRMAAFPASGEINSKLAHPVEAINRVEQHFSREALAVDRTDGISMTFADWRFNLRTSNTEPVVRLNVESRGDVPLMEEKTKLILELLNK